MVLNLGPLGKSRRQRPPQYSYTGSSELYQTTLNDGTVNWELVLLSSGKLTFSLVVDAVDVFLCGGGANGSAGSNLYTYESTGGYAQGGKGGAGGQAKTERNVAAAANTEYNVTIGGAGENTSISELSLSASGGSRDNGGDGAKSTYYTTTGCGDVGNGVYPFETNGSYDPNGLYYKEYKYGAGGGGGGAVFGGQNDISGKSGGSNGGGNGGSTGHRNGYGATANSGSGGGGGYATNRQSDWDYGSGGAGGSGIIIIRNAR